jgi:hypothetical protein
MLEPNNVRENCVLIIIWEKFEPIWRYLDNGFVGVHVKCI